MGFFDFYQRKWKKNCAHIFRFFIDGTFLFSKLYDEYANDVYSTLFFSDSPNAFINRCRAYFSRLLLHFSFPYHQNWSPISISGAVPFQWWTTKCKETYKKWREREKKYIKLNSKYMNTFDLIAIIYSLTRHKNQMHEFYFSSNR